MKRLLLSIALLFFSSLVFAAASASSIFYASHDVLVKMCELRGLETSGSDSALRERLYKYEGIEAYTENRSQSDDKGDYEITIDSAESLSKIENTVVLSGNASVSFKNGDSSKRTLSATSIIIDAENKRLTALENVKYTDSDSKSAISEMEADIVTVFWNNETLYITDATTFTDRTVEGEKVTFYTTGETLTYLSEGGLLYEDGYLTTDPKKRYSSITASQIAILPGEDMFITNAYISVGRVPFLWLPFFMFPGSRILGNPAFGFSSSHGAFLNTTFEILGSSPDISTSSNSSSFSSLFSSGSSGGNTLNGFYYGEESGEENRAQKWAQSSKSYIALMADAFSGFNSSMNNPRMGNGGIHFGVKSNINLFSSLLKMSFFDGIGLSSPPFEGAWPLRWYGQNTLSYSQYGLSVNLSLPFYSDPNVLVDFGNRITGFSMDAIMSPDSIEFPSTYSSSINSFNRTLSLSYTLPGKYTNLYLSSFSISNLTLQSSYTWNTYSQQGMDIQNRFILDQLQLPTLQASIAGALYDVGTTRTISFKSDEDKKVPESEVHILNDPLLKELYKESENSSTSRTESYSSSLKYSISENLAYSDDYTYGRVNSNRFSSNTSARITLSAALSSYFTLTDVLTPSYSYQRDQLFNYSEENEKLTTETVTENTIMNNELSLSIPIAGLTYSLSTRLLNSRNTRIKRPGEITEQVYTPFSPSWDSDTITQHRIGFSKSFATDYGTFTPSISYTIAPLTGSIDPSIGYRYGAFAMAFSWRFNESKDHKFAFDKDMIALSLGYNGNYVTFNSSFSYQSRDYDPILFWNPFSMNASLSLRTKDNKYSVTEYVEYAFFNDNYSLYHYFNTIRTTINIPYVSAVFNFKTQLDTGKVEFNDMSINLNISTQKFQFWKGRIYLSFGLNSSFRYNAINRQNSSFTFTPSITFSIAEFADFVFSTSSYNNSFYTYFNSSGDFDFLELFKDLGRSFDIFGGGIYNTHFLMRSLSLSIVHYMQDWNLNASLSTQVMRNGNTYDFVPTLSVYLSWKTLPELKVDQKWERRDGTWENQNSNNSLFNW